jgi:cytochrome c-type biogenesis protein
MTLSIGLAFLAGLASFLSPCVFSLVPAYIGYLAGRTIESDRNQAVENSPFITFVHGIFFVAGFSLVFILLGMAFSAVGNMLYAYKDVLAKIGGVVVILFGIHMTGIYRFPFLEYDLRPHNQIDHSRGFLSSFLLGVFFSAGWSPCVGPVLGAILALALNQGNMQQGTMLLIFYSLGMAIPFLIAALGVGWVGKILRKYAKVLHYLEIGMGGLLIIIGILLILGIFSQLAGLGMPITFGL